MPYAPSCREGTGEGEGSSVKACCRVVSDRRGSNLDTVNCFFFMTHYYASLL